MISGEPTRRQLLGGGIAGMAGAGALAAALVPSASAAPAPAGDEAKALAHSLQIEQLVVISYRQALASGVLNPRVEAELRRHLAHELAHVAFLEAALTARGQRLPPAPGLNRAQAALTRHQVHWSLTHLRSQHDCLKLLVDVESLVENAHFHAVRKVQDPALLAASAEIMGCEAQHWTVLSGFLNHQDATKAAPYPFVEGTP